jgi:ADP-ribose pyrophosphatase YjhB (NUDIX family)
MVSFGLPGRPSAAGKENRIYRMSVLTRHAARGLIMTPQNKVLLMKMDLPWIPGGAWTVPGGGIEAGETAEQCAIREVHEETGLKDAIISRELLQCDFRFQFRQQERRLVERYFGDDGTRV